MDYIEGDELNIRLAYYDYGAENPNWVENGKGERRICHLGIKY